MNAQEIKKYKTANKQKIKQKEKNKKKLLPKRYMKDANASFIKKGTDKINEVSENKINVNEIAEVKIKGVNKKKTKRKKEKKQYVQFMPVNQDRNVFYESLADMDSNDILLNAVATDVKKPSFDFVRYFALLLSLVIFVFSGYNIIKILNSYVEAARKYADLRDMMLEDDDSPDTQFLTKTKYNSPIQDILALQKQRGERFAEVFDIQNVPEIEKNRVKMKKIANLNSDLYCWIKVGFTTIDYPVVQTADNDYYLTHDFYKGKSKSGAIFADFRNSKNILDNRHVIIYGHNMLDNSMFQPLIDYSKREDYFRKGIIELITDDATYYYEVYSVSEEDPDSGYIRTDFYNDDDYVAFLDDMKNRSNFQKNITLNADSKILTLSTCINNYWVNRRFVVRGVLTSVR